MAMQDQRDTYKDQVQFLETILTEEQLAQFKQKFQFKFESDQTGVLDSVDRLL